MPPTHAVINQVPPLTFQLLRIYARGHNLKLTDGVVSRQIPGRALAAGYGA